MFQFFPSPPPSRLCLAVIRLYTSCLVSMGLDLLDGRCRTGMCNQSRKLGFPMSWEKSYRLWRQRLRNKARTSLSLESCQYGLRAKCEGLPDIKKEVFLKQRIEIDLGPQGFPPEGSAFSRIHFVSFFAVTLVTSSE